jgi:hypothetical protein
MVGASGTAAQGPEVEKVDREVATIREQIASLQRERDEAIERRRLAIAAGDEGARKAQGRMRAAADELLLKDERLAHLNEFAMQAAQKADAGGGLDHLIRRYRAAVQDATKKYEDAHEACHVFRDRWPAARAAEAQCQGLHKTVLEQARLAGKAVSVQD